MLHNYLQLKNYFEQNQLFFLFLLPYSFLLMMR